MSVASAGSIVLYKNVILTILGEGMEITCSDRSPREQSGDFKCLCGFVRDNRNPEITTYTNNCLKRTSI